MTFIAGLRHDGMTAPWVLDGPMDGPAFITYIKTQLAPTLRKGDVVVMDNLANAWPVSIIRSENPHSLSYQLRTRTSPPSVTLVCCGAKQEECGLWLKSIETIGSAS